MEFCRISVRGPRQGEAVLENSGASPEDIRQQFFCTFRVWAVIFLVFAC